MELILRKCATGETVRVHGTKVLCRRSRKLALLAAYGGQWVFHALPAPGSTSLLYNRLPAPVRCPVAVGDLLELDGLDLVIDSAECEPETLSVPPGGAEVCEVEVPGESRRRIQQDMLIGYDPCCGVCLSPTLDLQPLTALLVFAAGHWHLHELNGEPLVRNGKRDRVSLMLADGDRVRFHDRELVFHIGTPTTADGRDEKKPQPATVPDVVPKAAPSSSEIDLVYRQAKELCRKLLPVLRESGGKLEAPEYSGGLRSWLRIFRRPGSAEEILERLHFLLSGSPRDRVWLFELARFFFQQSYQGLCLQVLKELCRLYPQDARAARALAQLYYQQGRNPRLPAEGRQSALQYAARCTQLVRRLAGSDAALGELERAVQVEQTNLRGMLAGSTPCPAFSPAFSPEDVKAVRSSR